MTTDCNISCCKWKGEIDDLYIHVERYHRKQIKEIIEKKFFELVFSDISCEPFLLDGNNGIYWFRTFDNKKSIKFGIFHIGTSEVETYKIKFGLYAKTGMTRIYGPFQTKDEACKSYDFEIPKEEMISISKVMSPDIRIYFMEDISEEDNEFLELTPNCVDWSQQENVDRNDYWVEKLTCSICYNYIRKDARFCENRHYLCKECLEELVAVSKVRCSLCRSSFQYDCMNQKIKKLSCSICHNSIRRDDRFCDSRHFICENCFEELRIASKLRCPQCRGLFLYDCSDEKIESLLKLLKFPGDKPLPSEITTDPRSQQIDENNDGNSDETVIEINEVDNFIVITLNGKEIQRIPS